MTIINIDKPPPFYHDYRIKYGALAFSLIALCALYAFEFRWFNLTLNLQKLVFASLLIGAAIGLYLGYYFKKYATDLTEKIQIYVFFLVLCVFFAPLFGSLSNRLLAFGNEQTQTATIYNIQAKYSSNYGLLKGEEASANQWKIDLETTKGLISFTTKDATLKDAQKGDQVLLTTKTGLWGANFIDINSLKVIIPR